jgi:hypothetical protein
MYESALIGTSPFIWRSTISPTGPSAYIQGGDLLQLQHPNYHENISFTPRACFGDPNLQYKSAVLAIADPHRNHEAFTPNHLPLR